MSPVTRLLSEMQQGTDKSADLFKAVYGELHQLARQMMTRERAGHTLGATALVHEVYLRMTNGEQIPIKSRAYFFSSAAEAMRRILVDHARRRHAIRRGGAKSAEPLDDVELTAGSPAVDPIDLLALDEAVARMEVEYPEKAKLVKLLYFAGLSLDEAAAVMGTSKTGAHRQWVFARAWLGRSIVGKSESTE